MRLLDGLVRYRFGDNVELMGAWASARDVEGPFRSKAAQLYNAAAPVDADRITSPIRSQPKMSEIN